MRASDGAMLTPLNAGDTVFNNERVQKLWDLTNGDISNFANVNATNIKIPDIISNNETTQKIDVHIGDNMDSLFTIEGNVTKESIPGLEKAINKMIPTISDKLGVYLKGEFKKI